MAPIREGREPFVLTQQHGPRTNRRQGSGGIDPPTAGIEPGLSSTKKDLSPYALGREEHYATLASQPQLEFAGVSSWPYVPALAGLGGPWPVGLACIDDPVEDNTGAQDFPAARGR
jgi:hypothetical protein